MFEGYPCLRVCEVVCVSVWVLGMRASVRGCACVKVCVRMREACVQPQTFEGACMRCV